MLNKNRTDATNMSGVIKPNAKNSRSELYNQ